MADLDMTMMKVQRLLTGPMGLRISLQGSTITVTFTDSSTRVNINFTDWGQNKAGDPSTLVGLSAPLLWEVEPTPAVFEWIARNGGKFYFGHVTASDDTDASVPPISNPMSSVSAISASVAPWSRTSSTRWSTQSKQFCETATARAVSSLCFLEITPSANTFLPSSPKVA